jgi:hypothetical protein
MGARESSSLKAPTMSRLSTRSKKNPPDVIPIAQEKSAPQKNPYVFTRAFARLFGVDQEQAVAGYLAATSPSVPNSTLPTTAALPSTHAPSDSSTGRPITENEVEIHEVPEIPNPSNMKLPPVGEIEARVTKSAPARGESSRATRLPYAKAPSKSSTGLPVTQNGVEIRRATEIPNPSIMKFPPVGEIQGWVTKSAPAQGERDRATKPPHAEIPPESSTGRPITEKGAEIRSVTEISNPAIMKFPPVGEIQGWVTKSVPAQGERDRATKLPQAEIPSESSTGRPITENGAVKLPPVGETQARATRPAPVQGERDRASKLPLPEGSSQSSPGQPVIENGVEIRKATEIPNPSNIKLPPVAEIGAQVTESLPAQRESDRATGLSYAKAQSESSTWRPITENAVETRRITEISSPSNIKLPPVGEVQAQVRKSGPAQGASKRSTQLTWETFAAFLLIVALAFAVWGFYTKEPDTREKHPVPPDSNSSASISPPASVAATKATKAPRSFEVGIIARKDVRVLIKADGRKLIEETLITGAEKSVRAANQVTVKTGNLGALDFEFNGQRLPSQGVYGEGKTLEFGPSGLEVIISNPLTTTKPGK